jgi:hypothetical protein
MKITHLKCRWMRTFFFAIWAVLFANSMQASASSNDKSLGLGVIFGEPTGLNLKSWTSRANAINIGLSYSFGNYFIAYGDYLWHFTRAFASHGRRGTEFVPYLGIGAELFFGASSSGYWQGSSSVAVGARIPLGLEFLPHSTPLGIFAEIVPGIGLVPGIFGFVQGGIGIRIYL